MISIFLGDATDSIPGLGRSLGGWHGNPLQYSCLGESHGQRSLAHYSLWGRKVSDMTNPCTCTFPCSRFFLKPEKKILVD